MKGLIADYQLTLPAILKRAEELFGHKEIVTRRPDKSFHRYTYADFVSRSKRLAVALGDLGLQKGDRVATLGWNTYQHLECYFGVPSAGLVLHTLNPRLSAEDLAYIMDHAGDKVLMVDETLLPVFESVKDRVSLDRVYVFTYDGSAPQDLESYEDLVAGGDDSAFEYPELDEDDAAAMCYTSGTTGRPKGALYSHRSICLHSFALATADGLGVSEADSVLPVVPMFHVNAWGMPFVATMVGSKQVMPGPHLDPESLLEDFETENVTFTAGVPTVFLAVLQTLDAEPGAYDLSRIRALAVGGSAAPESMIRGFDERHGLKVVHAWGMTETDPVATVSHINSGLEDASEDEKFRYRAKQGTPLPFIEVRARGEDGLIPWDGQTMGELEVRGPWVASRYYEAPEGDDKFTSDGWFRTGDVVSIDPMGYVEIRDRDKDLVKSGGEWISSVDLENVLMGHSAVAEAAVIAVPDPRWQERPLGVIVLKEGQSAEPEELKQHLADNGFAKWQLPDNIEFVSEIPRTATGKFLKMRLREQFEDYTPA